MADAGGAFVTRAFERMLKDATGRKQNNLRDALKAYLERSQGQEPSDLQQTSTKGEASVNSHEDAEEGDRPAPAVPEAASTSLPSKPTSTGQAAAAILAEAGHNLEESQADLVVLPLRLAIETKQAKLVETALDCLHKLIAYGHLGGEAGLEGGRNVVMATQLFNLVCGCADNSAPDSVILQVIKVLLTAVASSSFQVHGDCLLAAVKTCYNIVLSSKNSVNQATAKATLTQMVSLVCKRMESEAQNSEQSRVSAASVEGKLAVISNGKPEMPELGTSVTSEIGEAESENGNGASSADVSLQELQNLAVDADIKGLEAALGKAVLSEGEMKTGGGAELAHLAVDQRDAQLVFRTVCKMSMKDGNDDLVSRTKILSLELLQGLLENISNGSAANLVFLDSVKAYLCYALLRACVSPNLSIFELSCGIFNVLLQRFRECLKAEIGIFYPIIILRSLESPESPVHNRTVVLKLLDKLCLDSQLLTDIFINYDCDLEATNLFERMVNSLSKIAQGTLIPEHAGVVTQNTPLKSSSLQCLVNVLKSLVQWTARQQESGTNWESAAIEATIGGTAADVSRGWASFDGNEAEVREDPQADFGKAKAHKSTLEAAVAEFNRKPEKGVNYLVEYKLVDRNAKAVAQFLRTAPGLNKTMIGDYLGQHEDFPLSVMYAYVDDFNFSGLKFDQAIREFLKGFRLPGEAQKIDRIMEKFAERFCRDNPSLFKNADTAYVLAYAVIMLNTDAHNPMVTSKMSKADFVKINSGQSGDQEEHAPIELLEEIYDSIVRDEIKMKDDGVHSSRPDLRRRDAEEKSRLVHILNLGQPRRKAVTDTKKESEEIVRRTRDLFRKGGVKRGVFHVAKQLELARPMLEAVGWPLLAAFSVTMEDSENKPRVLLCMEGFQMGVHLTKVLGMETMRYAFLTSLVRFTFTHSPREMRTKNAEALRTLLAMAEREPDALQDTWNALLECVSRLEFITSSSSVSMTLMQGSNQVSREALLQSLVELMAKPAEQVFVNSVKLPSDAIVEFFTALCSISAEELKQTPPRVFSLQKLVEISYYNMTRIRMVWARIWVVLSRHFVAAGSHPDEKISMYAIDSLRQLAIKYLERAELANFSFQNDILKPFVILMRNTRNQSIRALIVDCIVQMIKSKIASIKSGWRSVFMVFTTAASDDSEAIADVAFENVEQVILEHFDQVVGDCLMDCVNCLIAFASNKASSRTSLKAIALLRICEDRLAEGRIPGGALRIVEDTGKGPDVEVAEYYWFPMLAGLSDLTSDARIEVRNCALEVLFDLLKVRGHKFSSAFWESVFHRVLFPIFDYVRHAGKDGEKPPSADQWLRETCIHSLRLLCDLFSTFYKEVSYLLPALLGLLIDCATRPDQALASISVGALVHLAEVGGHQFSSEDWTTLLDSIRDACYTTRPVELLNSAYGVGLPSSALSGTKVGTSTPLHSFSGELTPGAHSDLGTSDAESSENYENGQTLAGTPKSNGDASVSQGFEVQEPERLSVAAEEGTGGLAGGQTSRRWSVMDTFFLKNFKGKGRTAEPTSLTASTQVVDVGDHSPDEVDEDPSIPAIRTKCVVQLLLLAVIDSFQKNHWSRFERSHKILIMDILRSLVEFAASYNTSGSLQARMKQIAGTRPPPNLLRMEAEATRIYLEVLNRAASDAHENQGLANGAISVEVEDIEYDMEEQPRGTGDGEKLREEAEQRLVTFYRHILKEAATLQPTPGNPVQAETRRCVALRSPVTVQVLTAMSQMDQGLFKKYLPEFYPYFTKLICNEQIDVRRALGDLFKGQLVALLP